VLGALVPSRPSPLQAALTQVFTDQANPTRAKQQQAYMKSTQPFAGLTAPELRAATKVIFLDHQPATESAWRREVLGLWRTAPVREQQHAAIELAFHKPCRSWLTSNHWDMLDELITSGAWWDFIDAMAPNHHAWLLAQEPKVVKPLLRSYATNNNLWRRRVAILCQLKAKTATDETLLFGCIKKSLDHKEFFVRKAIGWALRAHSRTNPDAVVEFIEQHATRLSPLSKREGMKLLLRSGAVSEVP